MVQQGKTLDEIKTAPPKPAPAVRSGRGIVIYRAESWPAARAIAATDPVHKAGTRHYELEPWLWNIWSSGAPAA